MKQPGESQDVGVETVCIELPLYRSAASVRSPVRTARHHIDPICVDLKLDRTRPLVREQRHTADSIRQSIAFELDVFVVALRNDAFIAETDRQSSVR